MTASTHAASDGRRVGVLGVNYSLQSIRSFATHAGRAQGITLNVTDRVGTSWTTVGAHGLVSLARDPRVRAALAGRSGLLDYAPVAKAHAVKGALSLQDACAAAIELSDNTAANLLFARLGGPEALTA